MEVNIKLDNLRKRLLELENVAIAYSGGVDSNFLLKVAKDTLKDKVIAVTLHAMMHSDREIEELSLIHICSSITRYLSILSKYKRELKIW